VGEGVVEAKQWSGTIPTPGDEVTYHTAFRHGISREPKEET
jgi:hypothetical protein